MIDLNDRGVVLDPVDIMQFWLNLDNNDVQATRITEHISAFIASLNY
jgi:hypothetical protein